MSRRSEAVGGDYLKNPSELYLEYNSTEKAFVYYNKETKENVKVKFPVRLVFLDERQTVGGWSNAEECSLYANEVKFLGKEPLTVKYAKGNGIAAKGLYKDIKEKLVAIGGKYYRSIYFVFEGKIINLKLKGSATAAWGDFASKNKGKFLTNYILIEDVVAKKSGGIKYTVPIFTLNGEIENGEQIDTIAEPLYAYLDQKKSNYEPDENDDIHASIEEQIAEPIGIEEGETLPF